MAILGLGVSRELWWGYWPQAVRSGLPTLSQWLFALAGTAGCFVGSLPRRGGYSYLLKGSALSLGGRWRPTLLIAWWGIFIPASVMLVVLCAACLVQTHTVDVRILDYLAVVMFAMASYLIGHRVGRAVPFVVGITAVPISIIAVQLVLSQLADSRLSVLGFTQDPSTPYFTPAAAVSVLRLVVSVTLTAALVAGVSHSRMVRPTGLALVVAVTLLVVIGPQQPAADQYARIPLCVDQPVSICTDRAHEAISVPYFEEVAALLARVPAPDLQGVRIDSREEESGSPGVMVVPLRYKDSYSAQWTTRALVRMSFVDSLVGYRCRSSNELGTMLRYKGLVIFGVAGDPALGAYVRPVNDYRAMLLPPDQQTLDTVMALLPDQFFAILAKRRVSPTTCEADLQSLS